MGVNVRQKVKGKGNPWWVFVVHQGKRKSMKVGTKKAAQYVAAKIETALASGKFKLKEKKIPTFGAHAKKWLRGYVSSLRESSYDEYSSVLRIHLLPVFKHKRVDEIGRGRNPRLSFKKTCKRLIPKKSFTD